MGSRSDHPEVLPIARLREVHAMPEDERPTPGARVRAERRARGWDKPEMAGRLARALTGPRPSRATLISYIKRWEADKVGISERYQLAYAAAFGLDENSLFPPSSVAMEVLTDDRAGGSVPAADDEDEMERRRLLQALAALGVSVSPVADAVRTIRDAFTSALPNLDCHAVSDWEEIASEYGYGFLSTPAAELLPDLAADVVTLQQLIRRTNNENLRKDLCRPGGQIAMLMALAIGALGNKREAHRWWQTARHIADASADLDLRVWVRGYEAMQALYERRPAEVVLNRAEEAIAIAGDKPRAAVLEAMAARAQALATLHRDNDAEQGVREMETVFAALPPASPLERMSPRAWPETGLRHTQSWVFTHTGHRDAAQAQDAALSLYPPQMLRQISQIRLLQATALVRTGDITDGIAHARTTLAALPPDQHTLGIQQGAYRVLSAVPETEARRPAVIEYREQIALPAAR